MTAPSPIRPAHPAEAGLLADLARRTFVETFGPLYEEADLAAFLDGAYGEALQMAELQDPGRLTLLAEQGGVPVGFAQMVLGKEAPSGPCPGPMELNRLYLLSSAHGTGLAGELMAAVLRAAKDRGGLNVWLGVWEHNHRAQAFYRRWGFVRTGEHFFRVGSRIDTDHILVRSLQDLP